MRPRPRVVHWQVSDSRAKMSPRVVSKNPRAPIIFRFVVVLLASVAQLMLVPVTVDVPAAGMVLAAVLLASVRKPVEVWLVIPGAQGRQYDRDGVAAHAVGR